MLDNRYTFAILLNMNYMNIRTFLRQINEIGDKLPLVVTRYGKPIFIVVEFNEPIVKNENVVPKGSGVKKDGVI
jgi:hypothetical protein